MPSLLNKLWFNPRYRWIASSLLPCSFLYWLGSQITYFFQKKQRLHFPVPIIIVGNLTTGGSGKTPALISLTQFLQSTGLKVGIVSRGYKSEAEHAARPLLVQPHHTAREVGDEPLLIYEKTKAPLAVHANRPKAIHALLHAHPGLDLILSDDGLQNGSLARDLEVLLIGSSGLGNGFILPAGPLRESKKRLRTVDFCVEQGRDFQFIPASPPLLTEDTVHAVCGIAHPERFFHTLSELGLKVIPHPFRDHHAFSEKDFEGMRDHPILMTEKDAVKCRDFNLKNTHALKMVGLFSTAFLEDFLSQVRYTIQHKKESLIVLKNRKKPHEPHIT